MSTDLREAAVRDAVRHAVSVVGIEGVKEDFGMRARNARRAAGIADFPEGEVVYPDHTGTLV